VVKKKRGGWGGGWGGGGGGGGTLEPKFCPHSISQPIFCQKFPQKCQMSVKICLKNVLSTFSLYLYVRYLVTYRGDQEIWSVSRRLQDSLGDVNLALMGIKRINSTLSYKVNVAVLVVDG